MPLTTGEGNGAHHPPYLVIIRMRRIGEIEHDGGMRLRAPATGELGLEIDAAVEMQRAVPVDVDVETLVVGGRVDEADVARLHEVVRHHDVFLVRGHFDVVGAHGGLALVGVVKAFGVVEVGDVEGGDVVGCCEGYCDGRGGFSVLCFVCVFVMEVKFLGRRGECYGR